MECFEGKKSVQDNQLTKEVFRCGLCSDKFHSSKNMADHMQTVHNQNFSGSQPKFQCIKCGHILKSKVNYRRHFKNVHSKKKPQKAHYTRRNLNVNQEKGSPKVFAQVCNICQASFGTKLALHTHQQIHSTVKSHKCNLCEKLFYSPEGLQEHHQQYHSALKIFKCSECQESFITEALLKIHQQLHSNGSICKICNKVLLSEVVLKLHMNRVHPGQLETSEANASDIRLEKDLINGRTVMYLNNQNEIDVENEGDLEEYITLNEIVNVPTSDSDDYIPILDSENYQEEFENHEAIIENQFNSGFAITNVVGADDDSDCYEIDSGITIANVTSANDSGFAITNVVGADADDSITNVVGTSDSENINLNSDSPLPNVASKSDNSSKITEPKNFQSVFERHLIKKSKTVQPNENKSTKESQKPSDPQIYKCGMCEFQFFSLEEVVVHIQIFHVIANSNSVESQVNGLIDQLKAQKSPEILQNHQQNQVIHKIYDPQEVSLNHLYEPRHYECSVCKMNFMTQNLMTQHYTQAHSQQTIVLVQSNPKDQLTVQNPPEILENYQESSQIDDPQEVSINHVYEPRHYECSVCKMNFRTQNLMTQHYTQNHSQITKGHVLSEAEIFKCHLCKKQFKSFNYLCRHDRNAHPEIKEFKCERCQSTYEDRLKLQNHHCAIKFHRCGVCQKVFRTIVGVKQHFDRVHYDINAQAISGNTNSVEKIHRCKICNKILISQVVLKLHMERMHSDIKLQKNTASTSKVLLQKAPTKDQTEICSNNIEESEIPIKSEFEVGEFKIIEFEDDEVME